MIEATTEITTTETAPPATGDPNPPVTITGTPPQPPPAAIDYSKLTTPEPLAADQATVDEIRALAVQHKLPLEAAQALVESAAARATAAATAQQTQFDEMSRLWATQLSEDKDIGGAALEANKAIANQVLKSHGSEELTQFLAESGLLGHPMLMKFLVKTGKDLAESPMLRTNGDTPGDPLRQLYDKSPQMWAQ